MIEQLGRIQEKALMPEGGESLTSAEDEILRAVDASLPNGWQDAARNRGREIDLEQRLEGILGFGGSSPANSLGGSSGVVNKDFRRKNAYGGGGVAGFFGAPVFTIARGAK